MTVEECLKKLFRDYNWKWNGAAHYSPDSDFFSITKFGVSGYNDRLWSHELTIFFQLDWDVVGQRCVEAECVACGKDPFTFDGTLTFEELALIGEVARLSKEVYDERHIVGYCVSGGIDR